MVSTSAKFLTALVVFGAIFYQTFVKGITFELMGYGRELSPLSSFDVRCEKVEGLGLEGCEDMWLHQPSGLLYLACSNSMSKTHWFPPSDKLNASAPLFNDRMAVLDTRASGPVRERLRWMTALNFDDKLHLHGIDIKADASNPPKLKMLLINHRTPVDPDTGSLLDATKVGGNATIEVFEAILGETTMKHIKTYVDPTIDTPNGLAWLPTSDDSFVFTNDHTTRIGFRRSLEMLLRSGGSVGYCDLEGCRLLAAKGLAYPNGIAFGQDGLLYIANSATGEVHANQLHVERSTLELVDKVTIPHPIDNLAVDSDGDIFVASFPQVYKFMESTATPYDILPPTAAWRMRKKVNGKYQLDKVIEDNGSILPCATIVVHDAQTGRMFLGGAFSPFISICEPR